nr:hypothetical protein [Tanacetum cinerariifolium]
MSHHQDIYDNPSLTKKVFANMKSVGTGFSRVITLYFKNMLVPATEEVGQAQDDVSIPTEPSSSKPHKKHKVYKLEEENRILKEKSFKSAKSDTTAPVEDKEESFKQGRMIADMDEDVEVKWIENGAKAGIYGFVVIKSAQCSKSRQSHEKSPSMPWKKAQENESNGALEFYWANP